MLHQDNKFYTINLSTCLLDDVCTCEDNREELHVYHFIELKGQVTNFVGKND